MIAIIAVTIIVILLIVAGVYYYQPKPPSIHHQSDVLKQLSRSGNYHWKSGNMSYQITFKLGTSAGNNGKITISYFDSLGGYLQGVVSFIAHYEISPEDKMYLYPEQLISSATRRWPNGQVWTLILKSGQLQLTTPDGIRDLYPSF